jgi:hypothetical protein
MKTLYQNEVGRETQRRPAGVPRWRDEQLCSEWNYDGGCENLKAREAAWIELREMDQRSFPETRTVESEMAGCH